jgi:hypothetical protein
MVLHSVRGQLPLGPGGSSRRHDPRALVIAATILWDAGLRRDDASVVVARSREASAPW